MGTNHTPTLFFNQLPYAMLPRLTTGSVLMVIVAIARLMPSMYKEHVKAMSDMTVSPYDIGRLRPMTISREWEWEWMDVV